MEEEKEFAFFFSANPTGLYRSNMTCRCPQVCISFGGERTATAWAHKSRCAKRPTTIHFRFAHTPPTPRLTS